MALFPAQAVFEGDFVVLLVPVEVLRVAYA